MSRVLSASSVSSPLPISAPGSIRKLSVPGVSSQSFVAQARRPISVGSSRPTLSSDREGLDLDQLAVEALDCDAGPKLSEGACFDSLAWGLRCALFHRLEVDLPEIPTPSPGWS